MKKNLIWGALALTAVIFSSCQKDESFSAPQNPDQDIEAARRSSVVVPDAPADIARVPIYVSPEFMQGGAYSSYVVPASANPAGTAGKGPRASTKDAIAPTVSITSPANGAIVTGSVTITVSASDNVGVSSVAVVINGATMWTWLVAPYSQTWTPPANGNYTITATAKDAKGNLSSHSIVISKSSITTTTGGTGTTGGGIISGTTNLPASYIMRTPAPFTQGGEGSCAAMAITMQRSIDYYYSSGSSSYDNGVNVFSPEFMYNLTKTAGSCGTGASLIKGLDYLYFYGVCRWNTLPYSSSNGCDSSIITSAMRTEALNYRIGRYRSMSPLDLSAIKSSLIANHPVSFSFQMDSNFAYAPTTPGYIWNSRGNLMSTHAVVIVGYDDSRKAFRLMNGWGSGFADQGFVWVDYSFFGTIASSVYAMY